MKHSLTIALILLFVSSASSQKKEPAKPQGYASAGFSFFAPRSSSTAGFNLSMGFVNKSVSTGFFVERFAKQSNPSAITLVGADLRAYVAGMNKRASPFVAVQPSLMFYNYKIANISANGSHGISIMVGGRVKPKGKVPGFLIGLGFQSMTYKITDNRNRSSIEQLNGMKVNVNLYF